MTLPGSITLAEGWNASPRPVVGFSDHVFQRFCVLANPKGYAGTCQTDWPFAGMSPLSRYGIATRRLSNTAVPGAVPSARSVPALSSTRTFAKDTSRATVT